MCELCGCGMERLRKPSSMVRLRRHPVPELRIVTIREEPAKAGATRIGSGANGSAAGRLSGRESTRHGTFQRRDTAP